MFFKKRTPKPSETVTYRFATLGGAIVAAWPTGNGGFHEYEWQCLGCDHGSEHAKEHALDAANKHAGECRSMPKPGGAL